MEDKAGRKHPNGTYERALLHGEIIPTFPKMSNGRPRYAIMLLRSEVRSEVGRLSVGARTARGGEPQSSSVCKSPGEVVVKPCSVGGIEATLTGQ